MEKRPEISLTFHKDKIKGYYLKGKGDPALLGMPELDVRVTCAHKGTSLVYPVFQQNAMNYGEYSEYVNHHGCACCSLTSLMGALCREYRNLRPEETIGLVERNHFPEEIWDENYGKSLARQMPVTLYGISRILAEEGIANWYVGDFKDKAAYLEIKRHLRRGKPVVIETSRIRRKNGIPLSLNDRRYAGSYHTMILLGFTAGGSVVFTDSATRDWAGQKQRLKSDSLSNLIRYMFPRINSRADNLYFDHRWNTGGYILIEG